MFVRCIGTKIPGERNCTLTEIVIENATDKLGGENTHVDIMVRGSPWRVSLATRPTRAVPRRAEAGA